jgi:hypothetical protein
MKNKVLIILGLALLAAGCNDSNDNTVPAVSRQASQAWKLTLKSKCPASTDATQCTAAYGFTANADGSYIVGPGPQGQVAQGRLSEDEFKSVTDAMASIKADGAESCSQSDAVDSDDSIVLTQGRSQHTVYHRANTDFCFRATSAEDAESVHQLMVQLAQEYYPNPFPDACMDAATKFENSYAALQSCNHDSDCAYLSDSFEPIAADNAQFVVTDDCTKLHPLYVGNAAAVAVHMTQIQKGASDVRAACGNNMVRNGCSQVIGFQSSDVAPVCAQHVCQAKSLSNFK